MTSDSPIFLYLLNLFDINDGYKCKFQGDTQVLLTMFEEGKATPYDRFSNGQTILHVSVSQPVARS